MEPSGFSLGFHPVLKAQYELMLTLEFSGGGTEVGKEKMGTHTWTFARDRGKGLAMLVAQGKWSLWSSHFPSQVPSE